MRRTCLGAIGFSVLLCPTLALALPLRRAPWLYPLAMPAELKCEYDQDGNGLDDEIEEEIALRFAPALQFDSAENSLIRTVCGPGVVGPCEEPRFIFSAMRTEPNLIKINYVMLFARDGGYATDSGACPLNDHDGDTESASVYVRLTQGFDRYHAEFDHIESNGASSLTSSITRFFDRPVLYPSAGKHHMYFSIRTVTDGCGLGSDRKDRADGTGTLVVPDKVYHAPLFSSGGANPAFADGTFANVCSGIRATRLRRNDLSDLGFPGRSLTDAHFRFDKVSGVSEVLAHNLIRDVDGDGLNEVTLPGDLANDSCPQIKRLPTHRDVDGDGIDDICDPEPNYRNVYVAGGNLTYPAAVDTAGSPWWQRWSRDGKPRGTRGGFLDKDRDGSPDGEDLCPSVPGGRDDRNYWGEAQNWPVVSTGGSTKTATAGVLHRGDVCDPYPIALPSWDFDRGDCHWNVCGDGLHTYKPCGDVTVPLTLRPWQGASANDPMREGKPEVSRQVTPMRCACRDLTSGLAISDELCASDRLSVCDGRDLKVAVASSLGPLGWYPIDYATCERDSLGECKPISLGFRTLTTSTEWSSSWSWTTERTGFVGARKHFRDDEFESVPGELLGTYLSSRYSYAIRSDVALTTSLGAYSVRGNAPADDPEFLDPELVNVNGIKSKRLRATFGATVLPAGTLKTERVVFMPTTICAIPVFTPRSPVLNWLDLDLRAKPHLGGPVDPHVFYQGDALFGSIMVGRADEGARTIVVDTTVPTWVTTQAGVGGMLLSTSENSLPDLLWVEQSGNSRWVRLTANATGGGAASYKLAGSGELNTETTGARMVTDISGQTAALVSSTQIFAYDAVLGRWISRPYPMELVGREDVSLALAGSRLYAAGGVKASAPVANLDVLDLFSDSAMNLSNSLPSRRGARLELLQDGRKLVYLGGVDMDGMAHDDIWVADEPTMDMSGSVVFKLLRPDSLTTRDMRLTTLLDLRGNAQFAVEVSPDVLGGLQIVRRTDTGWLAGRHDSGGCVNPTGWWNFVEVHQGEFKQLASGEICANGNDSGTPIRGLLPVAPVSP